MGTPVMTAGMRPHEWIREIAAGAVAAAFFLYAHYALTFPHWQIPGVAPALAVAVALGAYAGIRLLWPDRPGRIERWLGLEVPLRPELPDDDPETLRNALQFTVDAARGRVNEPVRAAIDRVVTAVEAVLAVWDEADTGPELAYTLRATVTQYLPDTLERYLKLPQDFRTQRAVRDGRTPQDLVVAQLGTLADELESIAEDVHLGNAQELAAHGRFLDERFSRQDPLRED